jgi:hypothetical protein
MEALRATSRYSAFGGALVWWGVTVCLISDVSTLLLTDLRTNAAGWKDWRENLLGLRAGSLPRYAAVVDSLALPDF